MSILVCGGAGYIGSHTCVELIQAGREGGREKEACKVVLIVSFLAFLILYNNLPLVYIVHNNGF